MIGSGGRIRTCEPPPYQSGALGRAELRQNADIHGAACESRSRTACLEGRHAADYTNAAWYPPLDSNQHWQASRACASTDWARRTLADRAGFEPARRGTPGGLATRYLQPLGHRSAATSSGTESGGRTRTRLAPHQGLGLARLPIVSPPRYVADAGGIEPPQHGIAVPHPFSGRAPYRSAKHPRASNGTVGRSRTSGRWFWRPPRCRSSTVWMSWSGRVGSSHRPRASGARALPLRHVLRMKVVASTGLAPVSPG